MVLKKTAGQCGLQASQGTGMDQKTSALRRQKLGLIDFPEAKILAHAHNRNQTRTHLTSDYSDRLLDWGTRIPPNLNPVGLQLRRAVYNNVPARRLEFQFPRITAKNREKTVLDTTPVCAYNDASYS